MKNIKLILIFFLVELVFLNKVLIAQPITAMELLEASDKFRSPYDHTLFKLNILDYKDNQLNKKNSYEVYHRDGESLVSIKTGANKNNRILLSNKGMYLSVKRSSRANRITPIQRLLGQASYGDLAGMKLATDYIPVIFKYDKETIILKLSAKNKKATYTNIDLWIDKDNYQPIKANAYLASGKLYKQMSYKNVDNQLKEITYTTPDIKNKKTVMHFLNVTNKKLPKRFFSSSGMRKKIR
jgi:hypothetical protein